MTQREGRHIVGPESFLQLVASAASAAQYDQFGLHGSDLTQNNGWAIYVRQSLEEQSKNNRLPEYLLTSAKEAKGLGALVPQEYIFYDIATGEHLDRPGMRRLRALIAGRRIAGCIFPALDRLSREPLHHQIFELEASHYGVAIHYADAPSGNDPATQFSRTILAHAAKLMKLANRKNNRAGNIGRVVKGWVPAGKVPFGYRYRKEVDPSSGATLRAWWEVNDLDPHGDPAWGSEAWAVVQVFQWIGIEGRSTCWAASQLNDLGVRPRNSELWSPAKISFIVKKRCYTGKHAYNTACYVPNPDTPVGDLAGEIKRTLRRAKPGEEHVAFSVPPLISESLFDRANEVIDKRMQSRTKTTGKIDALLRGRVFCPKCGRRMTIRRDGRCHDLIYYICTSGSQSPNPDRCGVRYIPLKWLDGLVWNSIVNLLKNPALVVAQMKQAATQSADLEKQVKLFDWQLKEAARRIRRIQDNWESDAGLYSADEARQRISEQRERMDRAEAERAKVLASLEDLRQDTTQSQQMSQALEKIRDANLSQASFQEKRRLVELLDVNAFPWEDRTGAQLTCAVSLDPASHQSISIASPKL